MKNDKTRHRNARIAAAGLLLAMGLTEPVQAGVGVKASAWRGETIDVLAFECILPEALPPGIAMRRGTIAEVRYRTDPRALQYSYAADRVVWSGTFVGPRIVEISVAPETKPGTYELGELTLTVVDRVLPPPAEWKYFLDIWQHPWAVARMRGVTPFSAEHYAAMRPLWELLATAGQKCLTVTLVDRPWNHQCFDPYGAMVTKTRRADGSWTFDFTTFDAYVAFGRSCGLGPKISCYTMCPWGEMVDYVDASAGEVRKRKAAPRTPFFEEYWGAYLPALAAHLKEKGWFDDAYIAMDERSPEDVAFIAGFVRKHAPGLRISMAGNRKPSDFQGIVIDNYSQVLYHVTDDFRAELPVRRAAGHVTTHYVCCSPRYPNTFLSSDYGEPFWCGFFPAVCGLDGMLRWAWNSWGQDPVKDGSYARWRGGETYLVYPDGSPSYRFLELRAGIRAAEKFRILRATGARTERLDALAKKFVLRDALNHTCPYGTLREEALKVLDE